MSSRRTAPMRPSCCDATCAALLLVIALFALGLGVARLHPRQPAAALPAVEEAPIKLKIELATAQAVAPGPGPDRARVRRADRRDRRGRRCEDGHAVVEMQIEPEYEGLIREDATALLRPKTAAEGHVPGGRPRPRQAAATRAARCRSSNTLPGREPRRDPRDARRRHARLPQAARERRRAAGSRAAAATCARCSGCSSPPTATSRA